MKYRPLGRTGLLVSEFSLGTVELGMDYGIPLGDHYRKPTEENATRLLNLALDRGINLIDTARAYGTSEDVIGRALHTRRSEYILASKVHHFDDQGLSGAALRQRVETSIAESLRALQADVIDIMQLHSVPANVIRQGELVSILEKARQAGYIRFIGATTYGDEAAIAVLEDARFDCLQVAYNLVDREVEDKVLPLTQQKNAGTIVRSVLLRGTLTKHYLHMPPHLKELQQIITKLDFLATRLNLTLPQLAYQFTLSHPSVSSTIIGTAYPHELTEILATPTSPLPSLILSSIHNTILLDHNQLTLPNWSV